ncbi:MAG: DUF4301 family protein, partial [Deltaproteobacteria bacterium]
MFTQKDLHQIGKRGNTIDELNRQIKFFKSGFPPVDIVMPATPGRGIIRLTDGDEQHYQEVYSQNAPDFQITRFIPASGAATRMFKSLFWALENLQGKGADQQQTWVGQHPEISQFLQDLPDYPFYEDLDPGEQDLPEAILRQILDKPGLDYGNKPKGLLK